MGITVTSRDEVRPDYLFGGNPKAIEAQEARGQQELVKSSSLPTQGLGDIADKLGIEVIGQVSGDRLFSEVRLPPGWAVKATDHSMWSKLVDDQGVERASIFYKAAFYDRDAFIRAA